MPWASWSASRAEAAEQHRRAPCEGRGAYRPSAAGPRQQERGRHGRRQHRSGAHAVVAEDARRAERDHPEHVAEQHAAAIVPSSRSRVSSVVSHGIGMFGLGPSPGRHRPYGASRLERLTRYIDASAALSRLLGGDVVARAGGRRADRRATRRGDPVERQRAPGAVDGGEPRGARGGRARPPAPGRTRRRRTCRPCRWSAPRTADAARPRPGTASPGAVAVAIVDDLEVVEVEEEHGEAGRPAASTADRAGGDVRRDGAPVEQPGQLVVRGQHGELALGGGVLGEPAGRSGSRRAARRRVLRRSPGPRRHRPRQVGDGGQHREDRQRGTQEQRASRSTAAPPRCAGHLERCRAGGERGDREARRDP